MFNRCLGRRLVVVYRDSDNIIDFTQLYTTRAGLKFWIVFRVNFRLRVKFRIRVKFRKRVKFRLSLLCPEGAQHVVQRFSIPAGLCRDPNRSIPAGVLLVKISAKPSDALLVKFLGILIIKSCFRMVGRPIIKSMLQGAMDQGAME